MEEAGRGETSPQRQRQRQRQRGPVPSPYWYWTSLSRNSLGYSLQLLQPSVRLPKYIYQAPPRRLDALRFVLRVVLALLRRRRPRRPGKRRWRRRWGRCAAPEGGRTRPSGASIPKTLGELCELRLLLTGRVTDLLYFVPMHVRIAR